MKVPLVGHTPSRTPPGVRLSPFTGEGADVQPSPSERPPTPTRLLASLYFSAFSSAIRRRLRNSSRRPVRAAVARCADLMGARLGWDEAEKARQVAAVNSRYAYP